jgi:vesicle-associated membrane protein 7
MASSSVPATPLLYACIAHKNTILAEHTVSAASGTSSLASVILPKISHDAPQKLTYTHNQNLIHYIADAGSASGNSDSLNAPNLTYLVVAKADLGRRVPFGFLVEIKKRFLAAYNPESTDFSALPAYGAAAYNAQLKTLMVEYGTTKSGQEDAFKNVQSEIDNVRGIMTENIERVLERGERLDLLVDKTDRLGGSARDFRVRSRGLKRRMWWKNMKLMVMLGLVIIFLLYLVVGMGCGLPGELLPRTWRTEGSTNICNSMVTLCASRLRTQLSPSMILPKRSSGAIP